MKIDTLIKVLQRVRAAKGNVDVAVTSFCGTNGSHVLFDLKPIRKNFRVDGHVNGHGVFCLHANLSPRSIKGIRRGIEDMKALGYRFFRSQFVGNGETPKEGTANDRPW